MSRSIDLFIDAPAGLDDLAAEQHRCEKTEKCTPNHNSIMI